MPWMLLPLGIEVRLLQACMAERFTFGTTPNHARVHVAQRDRVAPHRNLSANTIDSLKRHCLQCEPDVFSEKSRLPHGILYHRELGQPIEHRLRVTAREISTASKMSQEHGAVDVYNAARKSLSEQLRQLNPVIASLYDRVLATLAEQPVTIDGLLVICHCVREIANNLPEAFGDVDDLPAWSDVSARAADLVRSWNKHMGPATDYVSPPPQDDDVTSSPVLVSVNAELIMAANGAVQASESATGNAYKRYSAVVLGRLETGTDATVTMYKKAVQFFTSRAHLNKLDPTKLPSTEELLSEFTTIESVLHSRLSDFFDIAAELASLQAAANRRRSPSARTSNE
jgi:hypothetical protein